MLSLRDAHPDELNAIGGMMVAAYAEYMPPDPPPQWREYENEIRDVRRRLVASTLIVAEEVGRLLGAVTYYPDATKETNVQWPASWAVFRLLAVHPIARGRGIGRQLTEECIRRARASNRDAVGLHTTMLMNVARAMYERMGFVRIPELDFFPMPTFRVMAYRLMLTLAMFALLLGLPTAPQAAEAPPTGRTYRIGYLGEGLSEHARLLRPLWDGLRDLGYVEGRNLAIDSRFAEFRYERLPDLAAELVRLKVDVLVTGGQPAIAAVKQATTTIPIVMTWSIDPVGAGFITSLARPGGNITGSTLSTGPEFVAKQLEILKEIVPKRSRVAILRQVGRAGAEPAALESAARKLGLTMLFTDVRTPSDLEAAFATMIRSRAGAFLILGGPMTFASRQQIADLAVQHRLPGIHLFREYAEAGLLLTFGASRKATNQRAVTYIDKIFKGTRPADLPVEEPTTFELIINRASRES